jgi:tRNA dimethylallyltransferase
VSDAEAHGWPYVHAQLAEVNPEAAARIRPTDPQRLQRALEVYRISGRSMSEIWADQKKASGNGENSDYTNGKGVSETGSGLPPVPYRIISLALAPKERRVLHERIALRFRQMLDAGFVEEVEALHRSGRVSADMPSMRCVGYRQIWDYLEGKLDHEQMFERGVIATRQLAKRQLTWLRSWPDLHWLETDDAKILAKALKIVQNAAS